MVLSDLSARFRSMTGAMPELMFSQNRALANAGAAVERDRRAAAERAAAEGADDFEVVQRLLAGNVVA